MDFIGQHVYFYDKIEWMSDFDSQRLQPFFPIILQA